MPLSDGFLWVRTLKDLLRLKVTDDRVNVVEDLIDEGHHLSHLHLDKVAPTLLGNLNEGVARHVLNSIMGLCEGRTEK